jgi:Family of unknown function (DUF6518)
MAIATSSASARDRLYAAFTALGSGLVLGVLTNLAQGWLPGSWNQLANSGAVWSVAAFAAGAVAARRGGPAVAAVAGLCAEVGLVVGYYGYAEFGRDGAGSLFYPLVWLVMAFVAGPVFGIAGAWWRGHASQSRRVVGLAALAGVFGAESLHYGLVLHYAPQAWAFFAVFVLVPLLAGNHRERALTLLTAVPFALVAYGVIYLGFLGAAVG